MNNYQPLYLGSKSYSRKMLLEQSNIPFITIYQNVNEKACDWSLSLQKVTASIAAYKMEHAKVPEIEEGKICFVLTADTLSKDIHNTLHGKPIDMNDARKKLIIARQGMETGTSFCIEKRVFEDNKWHVLQHRAGYASAKYTFDVPDSWIDRYFVHSIGLSTAGAIAIEDFGLQFLKEVRGSYSAIIGLPIYEVRETLEQLGFFD